MNGKHVALLASVAVVVALSGGIGYVRGVSDTNQAQFEKFKEAAVASQQAANTQANDSAKSSALVDKQQAASTNSINAISDEVSKRLQQQEPKIIYRTKVVNQCANDEDTTDASTRPQSNLTLPSDDAGNPWRFDRGTVRLLNAARLGLPAESAAVGHGEGDSAPSTVGIGDFASNDLQVVARYHALKIKHDALVDWVDRLKSDNIGLCVASEPLYPQTLDDP